MTEKRLNDWAKSLVPGLLTALVVSMVTLSVWVVEIRANRFTFEDGQDIWRELAKKAPAEGSIAVIERLNAIDNRLERIEEKLP
jgi:hypothetical protein